MELLEHCDLGGTAVDAFCENHPDYSDADVRVAEGQSVIDDCIADIMHYAIQQALVLPDGKAIQARFDMVRIHVLEERGII